MNRLFICILFFCVSTASRGEEYLKKPVIFNSVLYEDLTWNKWDTDNFVVLSIDKDQGLIIKKNIEKIKYSVCDSLGLEKNNFPIRCKVLCVPNNDFLKRLFNIENSLFEIRYEKDIPVSSAIWISFEDLDLLDSFVYANCISDGFSENKNKIFIQKGVFKLLNKNSNTLKDKILLLDDLSSKEIFETTDEEWDNFSKEEKDNFENKSAVLCLLFRKEFGKNIFGKLLKEPQEEESLKSLYGFENFSVFDLTLNRYLNNIKEDIKNEIIPDEYLSIK